MEYRWWASVYVFVTSVFLIFYLLVCNIYRLRTLKHIGFVRRALLVIAHPDDECMFFGPTVIGLLQQKCELYLLCLSIGNYYQQGKKRKEELHSSCRSLGIKADNIVIVQHRLCLFAFLLCCDLFPVQQKLPHYVYTLGNVCKL